MKKINYPILLATTMFALSCSKSESVDPPKPPPKPDYSKVQSAVPNKVKAYARDIENKNFSNLPSYFHSTTGRDWGTGFPIPEGYTLDIKENSIIKTGEFSSGTVKYKMPYSFNSTNGGGSSTGNLEVIVTSSGTKTISSSWKFSDAKEGN